MAVLYKDHPIEIQELIKKRRQDYALRIGINKGEIDPKSVCTGLFAFDVTPEGRDFWYDINSGDYSEYYNKHPKTTDESFKVDNISPGVYKAKSGNKNYEITIKEV